MSHARTTRTITAAILAAGLFAGAALADEKEQSKPEDIQKVVSALRDGKATSLQKRALTGKVYTGTVHVSDVSGEKVFYINSHVGRSGKYETMLQFTTEDQDLAAKLQKGDMIRVTATLGRIGVYNLSLSEVAEFKDLTVEEVLPARPKTKDAEPEN